jgi:hypothetical protein
MPIGAKSMFASEPVRKEVFANDPGCTTRFTEETLSHQVLRDLLHRQITNPAQVNKQVVLNIIDKASKV